MKQLLYLIMMVMSIACHQETPNQSQPDLISPVSKVAVATQDTEATMTVPADERNDHVETKGETVQSVPDVINVKIESKDDTKKKVISKPAAKGVDAKTTRHSDQADSKVTSPTKEQPTIGAQVAKNKVENVSIKPKAKVELHQPFNELLQKYVSQRGAVDYAGFLRDEHVLTEYLAALSTTDVSTLESRAVKMAFWINLYNAATIQLIIENYPLEKIIDLDGGKPWDVKRVKTKRGVLSLNAIENGIIRPEFRDPRIHFAVNCAAKSCPPLANQAYTEKNLDELMTKQANAFINNKSFNEIRESSLSLSKIFEWYADDFTKNIIDYINVYSEIQAKQDATVTFKEYDWSLNGT